MSKLAMSVGKIYGGVKVVEMIPRQDLITVECLICGTQVKRNRSNVRSKRIMSCGRFACKSINRNWNKPGFNYED